MEIQKEIEDFLITNKVATICYVKNGLPYCFNCLYAILPGAKNIVFKSSMSSMHGQEMRDETPVAGTIYFASQGSLDNAGIQFNGAVTGDHQICAIAKRTYYKRFPMALVIPGQLFIINFNSIKFSQTKNIIQNKVKWQRTS